MTSASTSRSIFHILSRQLIMSPAKQWLSFPIASSQCVEAYLFLVYIYFASDEAMRPICTYFILSSEHYDTASLVSPPDVDDLSSHFCLIVSVPLTGELSSLRCRVLPCGFALVRCLDITVRSLLQCFNRSVLKSTPHFRLPQPVVALYGILQTMLSRRRKDRHNCEAQTNADHFAYRIWVLMRSLKAIVVVELSKRGQSYFTPMLDNGCQSR